MQKLLSMPKLSLTITRRSDAIPIMPKLIAAGGEAWQYLKEQKKADADLAVAKALETDTVLSVQA